MNRQITSCLFAGFSLVETLVVLAIVSILTAMVASSLHKAVGLAKETARAEGVRQTSLSIVAEHANEARLAVSPPPNRIACSAAFRQWVGNEDDDASALVTQLLYVVKSEDEFEAYYNTLIDPDNDDPLEFQGQILVAEDDDGNTHLLKPIEDWMNEASRNGRFPVMWEFLSTNLADTNSSRPVLTVAYCDGSTEKVRYGDKYPASQCVAEKSREYAIKLATGNMRH